MSKFKAVYDVDVANMALSMGWDHRVYGDLGSHEAAVARIQEKMGLSFEDACQFYRDEILAAEIALFFDRIFGKRTE